MPRISVVMPAYNASHYLQESVSSVLNQTYSDFELLILDDGSTDQSAEILDAFASRDKRVRVTHRPNKGVTVTRNELIAQCNGDFMAVLDADDIALPHRLERQIAYLNDRPDVVCLGSWWDLIDQKGRMLTRLEPPTDNEPMQKLALEGHSPLCNSATVMRLEAVRRVGGYDPVYAQAEDLDLFLKLGEIGQLANLPEVLVRYRMHPGSISERKCEEQRECARRACEQAWARRGIDGQFTAGAAWRASGDRASQHRYALKYGWWAFNSGESRTAMIYGLKSIAALPLNPEGWKLLLAGAVKKPVKKT